MKNNQFYLNLQLTKPIPEDVLDARSVNAKNLTSLALCDTYGWGGNRNKVRKITNSVLNADKCSFQSSAKNIEFCTVMSPTLCSFWYGSPVFCGGQDISGILLPGDCNSEGFYRVVKLNEYENWIKSVTGSSKMIKPTVANLLMSSFLLILIYSCYS